MSSTRMMTGQTARAVRAIEQGQRCMRIYYTERASRHYRTSCGGVGVERDFCIAMVFGPQQMLGCIGRLAVVLVIDVYTCCFPIVLSNLSALCAPSLPLPPFRPRRASLVVRVSLSHA
jgi:hypothetical protein